MNSCEAYRELLSAKLDGELTGQEQAMLEAHLAECEECRSLYEIYQQLSDDLALPDADLPDTLIPGVMARVAAEQKKKSRRWIPILAGAAACIAIVAVGAPKLVSSGLKGSSADCEVAMATESMAMDMAASGAACEESIAMGYETEAPASDEKTGSTAKNNGENGTNDSAEVSGAAGIYNQDAWREDPVLSVYHDEVLLYGPITQEILNLGACESEPDEEGREQYILSADREEELLDLLEQGTAFCWFGGNPDGTEILLIIDTES